MLNQQVMDAEKRILVSAFTHHAINNVLSKITELADQYSIPADDLAILKLQSSHIHAADRDLPAHIQQIQDDGAGAQIQSSRTTCLIVGSTVWGIYTLPASSAEQNHVHLNASSLTAQSLRVQWSLEVGGCSFLDQRDRYPFQCSDLSMLQQH
jgi:hypothetical protein